MAQDQNHLIWLDMEMTGLDPMNDRIIELAIVITDSQLNVVAEAPVWVVHQADEVLDGMDDWNKSTHSRSGLIERVRQSTLGEEAVATLALAFLEEHVPKGASPMCGNSICQDRRFMARWMPQLEAWFHYRNLDVSTLKELCKRWQPEVYRQFKKQGKHTALADIQESIDELRFYREHFLKVPAAGIALD
ncbi:oligoribonuclease [Chitiniphilus purpureus]|uniref:Oligoribonuclease n=1 Tax=Chitiniphilus purpureus TaxID=2981137 RepID=A0ABY6DHW0_9NEIS|nr:oligoribonuclease [Chitiniphilus sp. CD1]UXY13939.1 oligoribonuclease [Chitiniphilus sp. CD1]